MVIGRQGLMIYGLTMTQDTSTIGAEMGETVPAPN